MNIMKTVLTLIAFSLVSSVVLAAEKFPSVIVTSSGEYEIIVDGKRYRNDKRISLNSLKKGKHYIDVFKRKKGLFNSRYYLVSSKTFELGNKDLHIDVNNSGYITIGKQGKGWDGDYWWRNKDKKDRGMKGDDDEKYVFGDKRRNRN
jgi:hypothetical protein